MRSVLVILLLFNCTLSLGQVHKGFRWIGKDHSIYSVDKRTGELYKESFRSGRFDLGKIQNWDQVKDELPGDFDINTFYHSDSLLITVPGTGQLYHLDFSSLSLNRLDQSYFRGYNFNASQFIRNDTIFSVGGDGFWQRHSILTFYNPRTFEWDIYKAENVNKHPANFRFSGYSKEKNAFFSAFLDTDSALKNKEVSFTIFDFKAKSWEVKGKLSQDLIDFAKAKYRSVWTGSYLILFSDSSLGRVLIVDPFENVLYDYMGIDDRFFLSNTDVYYQNNFVYSGSLESTGKNGKLFFDSLSVDMLFKKSTKLGKVYKAGFKADNYVLSIIALLVIIGIMYKYRKTSSKKGLFKFSDLSRQVILVLIQKSPEKRMSSSELNNILQLNLKSYDNQRQIRNRVIGAINQKLYDHFESKDLILRSSNNEDKRMMDYFINPEIKQKELEGLSENI